MEGRGGGDFAALDRQAAVNFGEAARDAGVERVVYLGGLGADASSSTCAPASGSSSCCASACPSSSTRAAMIIGPGRIRSRCSST